MNTRQLVFMSESDEQRAMTLVSNGESHEHNSLTMSNEQRAIMTMVPNGETHELNSKLTISDGPIISAKQLAMAMVSNGESEHVHSDSDFDVASLLDIVDNIFRRSTHIVDCLVQGSQPIWEPIEDYCITLDFNFVSPLCILRNISSELSCKAPGVETAQKTALAILKKLVKYEWDAQVVITLAALAMEYGDFWQLAQNQSKDLLVKLVGILKRVNGLTMRDSFEENSQAILELNTLIKTVLELIRLIFNLVKLNASYDTKDVPALEPAFKEIPDGVKWCIITIAGIASQIDSLAIASHHTDQNLSLYYHIINIILAKLRKHFKRINQQIVEHKYITEMRKRLQTPTEVLEVFNLIIFSSDAPRRLYDGTTKKSVDVEVLRNKKVLLFISTLEVTEEEISVIRKVHEGLKATNYDEQYKLVWIPMVEKWTVALRKKMEIVKAKMPWYVVQVQHSLGIIEGHKFIKQDWQFKKEPMVVVMDHQGMVKHKDAFHFIKVRGMKAFPFDQDKDYEFNKQVNWLYSIIHNIYPTINLPWIEEEEKYTLFYGGRDQEWVQKFTKVVKDVADDVILKSNNISIELVCVEREEYRSKLSDFWSKIESHCMITTTMSNKHHKTMEIMEEVTHDILKIASYKDEPGWALLFKGSTVILSGNNETVLMTVMQFNEWKETVITKGFAAAFKEHHLKIEKEMRYGCSMIAIENVVGKLPHIIECRYCRRGMGMISAAYKSHNNLIAANAIMH